MGDDEAGRNSHPHDDVLTDEGTVTPGEVPG